MVHPRLTHREGYTEEILLALSQAKANIELETKNETSSDDKKGRKDTQKISQVPYFYLEPSIKKWGTVTVETLRINSAKEDAELLKFLFSRDTFSVTFHALCEM